MPERRIDKDLPDSICRTCSNLLDQYDHTTKEPTGYYCSMLKNLTKDSDRLKTGVRRKCRSYHKRVVEGGNWYAGCAAPEGYEDCGLWCGECEYHKEDI